MHEEGDHATKKQLSGSLLQGDGLEKRLEQWECILHDQHGRLLPQRLANGPLPHHHFAQICRKEEAPLLLSPHTSKKCNFKTPRRPEEPEVRYPQALGLRTSAAGPSRGQGEESEHHGGGDPVHRSPSEGAAHHAADSAGAAKMPMRRPLMDHSHHPAPFAGLGQVGAARTGRAVAAWDRGDPDR